MRKAGHQRGAVERLELVQLAGVHHAGDDLADVEGLARVGGDHAVQLRGIECRFARLAHREADLLVAVQMRDDAARDLQRVDVVERVVVGHP